MLGNMYVQESQTRKCKKELSESHWRNTKYKDVGYVCTRITDLEMQKRVT